MKNTIKKHAWVLLSPDGEWIGSGNDQPLIFKTNKCAKLAQKSYLCASKVCKVALEIDAESLS